MRAMRQFLGVCTLGMALVMGFSGGGEAWAGKQPVLEPGSSAIRLNDLRTFSVHDMQSHEFSPVSANFPYEVVEYARLAIQNEPRLKYESFPNPPQGVLRFSCVNEGCSRIQAEISHGLDGPVVWRTVRQYRPRPFINFGFFPNSKKFAGKIVKELAKDYQSTVEAAPRKIQITD